MKITLVHASGNTFMSAADTASDVQHLLGLKALIYTLTETSDPAHMAAIRKAAAAFPYQVINPDQGDIAFLVHRDAQILTYGGPLAIPRQPGRAADGGHGPRHNSYISILYRGEHITHTGVHFVTAHPDPQHNVFQRRQQQLRQASLMGRQMKTFAQGRHIATGSGDINASVPHYQRMQRVFDTYGLTTTQHSTGNNQTTHGPSRIDYIWTSDADHRVTVASMRVIKSKAYHSDHDPVVAMLNIRKPKG